MNTKKSLIRFAALYKKEFLRFYSVKVQTIAAPLATTFLYLLVFGQVLEGKISVVADITYSEFILPGLIMMTMMQNSFSNASSSLIQSKMHGNILFALVSPITVMEFTLAFILAATTRGIIVGVGVLFTATFFVDIHINSIVWLSIFAFISCIFMGALGFIAGIVSKNVDQLSALQNFVIVPLTFLSGVFYSLADLSSFWQTASLFNPFFYLVDGFRYGFFDTSDVSVSFNLAISCIFCIVTLAISSFIVSKGYRLRQ